MKTKLGILILILLLAGYFAIAQSSTFWKPISLNKSEGKTLLLNPDTHTYDYTILTGKSAYTGRTEMDSNPPLENLLVLSGDYYSYIAYDDYEYADAQGADWGDRPGLLFTIGIDEAVETISSIDIYVKGRGGANYEEPYGWSLWIYDSFDGWVSYDTTSDSGTETTLHYQITDREKTLQNYLDGGNINFLAFANHGQAGGTSILVNYTYVTVTYTIPPTANAQLMMINE